MYNFKSRKVLVCYIVLIFMLIAIIPLILSDLSVVSAGVSPKIITNKFDEEDLAITIALHVLSEPDYDVIPYPERIEPLYNLTDEITSYNVTMSDTSYMVVNANRNNPVVLEFGSGCMLETEIINTEKNYYISPGIIAKKDKIGKLSLNMSDSENIKTEDIKFVENKFANFCKTPNLEAKSVLEEAKITLQQTKALQLIYNTTLADLYDFLVWILPTSGLIAEKDIVMYGNYAWGNNEYVSRRQWSAKSLRSYFGI